MVLDAANTPEPVAMTTRIGFSLVLPDVFSGFMLPCSMEKSDAAGGAQGLLQLDQAD